MSSSSEESGMDNFTIAELGVFLGVLGETINCCGIKCKRKVDNPPQDGGPPEQNPNPALPALPRA